MDFPDLKSQLERSITTATGNPNFKLVQDYEWFGVCPASGEQHRQANQGEGGVVCLSCAHLFIPREHYPKVEAGLITEVSERIAVYLAARRNGAKN